MAQSPNNAEGSKNKAADYYDKFEEASKRPSQKGNTELVSQLKNDDVNEKTTQGTLSTPIGNNWADNKVSTSLDDEKS